MSTSTFDTQASASLPLPCGPILGWSSFKMVTAQPLPSIENLPYIAFTTSGRAAIYQALLQLQLPPGSSVLVPSYHCPTMVAPVLLAHLSVAYFGLRPDGLPNLDTIDAATANRCKAMLVAHYFGLPKSLAEVRKWCDDHAIALIEDCAHCYFGTAGERPIGAWGDFSTASISKFFPVPEGGILASAHRPIRPLELCTPSLKAQFKAWIDVVEMATYYQRLTGLNRALSLLFKLKNSFLRSPAPVENLPESVAPSMMHSSNMGRIAQAPLRAALLLKTILPRNRIIRQRQKNFLLYALYFENSPGAKPLFPLADIPISHLAPYVFPLWVDDAERIYHALRALKIPVFRWDKIWPGTPQLDGDVGPLWSQHVLQLLCHQDLSQTDIQRITHALLNLLPPLTTP